MKHKLDPVMDRDLAYYTVCHGEEGTLPLHCPGTRMSMEQQDAVYEGAQEYYAGAWRQVHRDFFGPPGGPRFYWDSDLQRYASLPYDIEPEVTEEVDRG